MFTIFFSHVRSVIIIYLTFPPLIIRTIACFTVKRSLGRLNSCQKMNEDVVYTRNTKSGCNHVHTRSPNSVQIDILPVTSVPTQV